MNYLLDTHIILWWLSEPSKIATKARKIISDKNQSVSVSSVSFWEMAIKQGIGRLRMPDNIITTLTHEGFSLLSLTPEEALTVAYLPKHHNDPFDRMLISQAKLNNMTIISRDEQFQHYPVQLLIG